MDPESYAALIEALSNATVTLSRDTLRSGSDWTTRCKLKWDGMEVVNDVPVETALITLPANTAWIPTVGQRVTVHGDQIKGRVLTISKVDRGRGTVPTRYKVEAQG